jgi:integrase
MSKLTQTKVDKLIAKREPLAGLSDGRGLTLTIAATGKVSWVLRYRLDGRMREKTLSNDPNLKNARKLAIAQLALLDAGTDPMAERRTLRPQRVAAQRAASVIAGKPAAPLQTMTFKDVCEDYERIAGPDLAKLTLKHTRQFLNRDILPAIGGIGASEVTSGHIIDILKAVAARSKPSALAVFRTISVVCSHGVGAQLLKTNPCDGIRLKAVVGKIKPVREVITLDASQIGHFLRAIPACGIKTELVLRILLSTGARKGEVLAARKTHINFDEATWSLPAENVKNRKAFVIPLAPQVLEWFRQLIAFAGDSEWIVPGRRRRDPASPGSVNCAINALDLKFRMHPHALRKTMRTHLTGTLKVADAVAEKALNHTMQGIMAVYNRYDYMEERREALERWVAFMERCEHGNVVPIRPAA